MQFNSRNVLKNQKNLFFGIVCIAILLSGVLFYVLMQDTKQASGASPQKLELPGDKINPQEIWMSRVESENKLLKKNLEYIEKTLLELKKGGDEHAKENDDLKKEVSKLKNELKVTSRSFQQEKTPENKLEQPVLSVEEQIKTHVRNKIFNATEDPFVSTKVGGDGVKMPPKPVFKEVIMGKAKRNIHHVDKAVPAGTTVKALLVSSIDATCSIYSKSDPQPVKLRILDNGHLPKDVEARLKGGLIIASAYGDISTERVYMRVERLTKVESNGEFIETAVTGFVSGEDGKFWCTRNCC